MNNATYITLGLFLLLLILQAAFPRREFAIIKSQRFWHNLGLFAVNFIIFSLLPLSLILIAAFAEQQQFGLFNSWLELPAIWEIVIVVVLMDFAVYWQHVFSHRWQWLWKFHQVHHLDKQIDVTTAVRFHPIEFFISLLFKGVCIFLLGASVNSVIIFEAILIGGAAFSHSNWRLSSVLDKILRLFIVTPDVHRVHHSVHREEHDSNFGFFLIWWDKLFNTYTAQPRDKHESMQIGLDYMRGNYFSEKLHGMLLAPFKDIYSKEKTK